MSKSSFIENKINEFMSNFDKLPKHIGFIMDGNRRFAKKRRFAIVEGHKSGAEKMHEIVKFLGEIGIPYMTVYAFSTENNKRAPVEVKALMDLLLFYLDKYEDELAEADVKINFIGEISDLSPRIVSRINEAENNSKDRKGLNLIIAFNYGSRTEIMRACQNFAKDCQNNPDLLEMSNPDIFSRYLYMPETAELDFIIRCGGELRLSNFLLWQAAYAELYFTDTLWPEFSLDELCSALDTFMNRERRYGGTV